jgi:hypothetical protein
MKLKETFEEYIKDEKAAEMFISGQAGTGKTTGLADLVSYCIDNKLDYIVCAYTHKACGILRSKLPDKANISTLHKFLKKRPTINEHATDVRHIQKSAQQGTPEEATILFLDEYSMVGDKDYADIGALQWTDNGKILMKVVYLGDPNQLPPVNDQAGVYPSGKYNIRLTKIYRQAGDNPLLDTLTQLVTFIEGAAPEPLKENKSFIRGADIVTIYNESQDDKIMLAYTNQRVQELNAMVAGKEEVHKNDAVFSPTTKHHYNFRQNLLLDDVDYIDLPFGDDPLVFGSKYKTLEHLLGMYKCKFGVFEDIEEFEHIYAYIFGHYDYKIILQELGEVAVEINNKIEQKHKMPAKIWAMNNKGSKLSRERARAWRDYFTFKNCVVCIDFPYAMTVHKSQGSTFNTVFLDTQDLGQCANRDYNAYLKLMYVAISRASNRVYTN